MNLNENRPSMGSVEYQLREIIGQDCELDERGVQELVRGPLKSFEVAEETYSKLPQLAFYLGYQARRNLTGWEVFKRPETEEEQIKGVFGFSIGTEFVNLTKDESGRMHMHIPMVGNVTIYPVGENLNLA